MPNARSHAASEIEIRPIMPTDAHAAARLSEELGYPVSAEAMELRIRQISNVENHAVYVACLRGQVVGWIDLNVVHHLQSSPYGEIGGLVVASGFRGIRIGCKLVEKAERWVADRHLNTLLVRSRITREAAHQFYLNRGFSRLKTSAIFTKTLSTE